jgi:hypothetical protein
MGTTGAQLAEWCKKQDVASFHGVFCSNTLPTPWQPADACFIVNHSACGSRSGGTHWLACRIKGTTAYWFDSYGLPPDAPLENELMGAAGAVEPGFSAWLQRCGVTRTYYHDVDIQAVTSEVCGLFASYFCKHGLPRYNKRAWRFLSSNVAQNDAEIKVLVRVTK